MSHPIWIVEHKLDFHNIVGDESSYIDAWETIVEHWIFEPARHLTNGEKVTDRGIALLTLELAFFKPFGSVLTGKDSTDSSHQTFSVGLKRFAEWLFQRDLAGKDEINILSVIGTRNTPNIIYSYARCGLMHKMTMQGGRIFIDARAIGAYPISNTNYKIPSQAKDGTSMPAETILLIDPWRLLLQLQEFVNEFTKELRSSRPEGQLYQNFKKTFERTFVAPGKIYPGL